MERVDGKIPAYINGTLFRNGPGKFGEPPSGILWDFVAVQGFVHLH